ncbi:MAG TPA: hypothetical protein VHT75_19100 [Acidimicrobiales bacterium]|nr:hypothetical protein [Acidimicrobiales bacterium]
MRARQAFDALEDRARRRPPHPLAAGVGAAIVALFEEWDPLDRSHRKLAPQA